MKAWAGRLYIGPAAQHRLRLTDSYSIHRILLELIDDRRDPAENTSSGLQWVDQGQTIYGRRVDFMSIHPIFERKLDEDVVLEVKEIPDGFLEHEEYRFQILVNPVKVRDGKRIPVVGAEKIEEWFLDKAAARGIKASVGRIDKIGRESFKKNDIRVVYSRARISGVFKVEDQELFKKAFFTGIGKGRAFGFGFLQLAVIK